MAFEETALELTQNVRSLALTSMNWWKRKVAIDFVCIQRSEIDETGDYDLEGRFHRLGDTAIDAIGSASSSTPLRIYLRGCKTRASCEERPRGAVSLVKGQGRNCRYYRGTGRRL